jgi:hypothetical protein
VALAWLTAPGVQSLDLGLSHGVEVVMSCAAAVLVVLLFARWTFKQEREAVWGGVLLAMKGPQQLALGPAR